MILGIVSDPHGNSYGLQAALHALDEARAERVVCAGDIVGYYPFVNETIDLLRSRDVACVAGNHDLYLRGERATSDERWQAYHLDYVDRVITSDNRRWLSELPMRLDLLIEGTRVLLCHGSPWSPEEYVYPDSVEVSRFQNLTADAVVMGHTHIPLNLRIGAPPREILLFNPGSCGQPRDYVPLAAYGVLDTGSREARVERVPYEIEVVRSRCADLGFGAAVSDILTRTR